MSFWRLIGRSMVYHRRGHLGLFLGVIVTCSVLTGALLIGDSIRYSLRKIADERLGNIQLAMDAGDRFVREDLAHPLAKELNTSVAPGIRFEGIATAPDRSRQANHVQILGIDSRFWKLGDVTIPIAKSQEDECIINRKLANRLKVSVGDVLVVRVEKPSLLPKDAVLISTQDNSTAIRVKVSKIIGAEKFGNFNLSTNQLAPYNLFLPLRTLQNLINRKGRVNLILVGSEGNGSIARAGKVLQNQWSLTDMGLRIRDLPANDLIEIQSDRIFLDPPIVESITAILPNTQRILTYFVNELRVGDRSTPYSMVTAIDDSNNPIYGKAGANPILKDMKDNEIRINSWCAEDLSASKGDKLTLDYFVVDQSGELTSQETTFTIRDIFRIEGSRIDRTLAPNIPGLSDSENCREWNTGVPIDLDKIRQKDEAYWERYRETPKALVTLAAGQMMWKNRFGNTTALRFPKQPEIDSILQEQLPKTLQPEAIGLFFTAVDEAADNAVNQSTDFSILFVSFSFFLIIASLLLSGLLFVFNVDQRAHEQGILLSLGFTPKWIQGLYLLEGLFIALPAACLGTALGALYTKTILFGLSTLWRDAVGNWPLAFHGETRSLIVGCGVSLGMILLTLYFCLRSLKGRTTRNRLLKYSDQNDTASLRRSRFSLWFGIVSLSMVVFLLSMIALQGGQIGTMGFFSAGALLLISGLAFAAYYLSALASECGKQMPGLFKLGIRNLSRHWGRSLSVMGMLACTLFVIISLESQRLNAFSKEASRDSGTGGFSLFAETTQPVYDDLNSSQGREEFGLDDASLSQVVFVPIRVLKGDDASCLNLNRAQKPQLLGVHPASFITRNAFSFAAYEKDFKGLHPWQLLDQNFGENTIPAIADFSTITYALGKKIGDTIAYTDEQGNTLNLRLVGALANSVLQGALIVDEDALVKHFPSVAGFTMFLVDTPPESSDGLKDIFNESFQDFGIELTTTVDRLNEFNKVQNTYISIFQVLGGLGMILGSFGLGILVLRNTLERRSEFALMRAIGFQGKSIHFMLMSEHGYLLVLGILCGTSTSLVAVFPRLMSPGSEVPWPFLFGILIGVSWTGLFTIWLAGNVAMKKHSFLSALRNGN